MDRETILQAAAQIFSEKGYHAASMQSIAQAVHLRKPSLYHHVSSKQEILLALLDEALDLLISRVGDVISQDLSPDEKLRYAMQTYIKTLMERRDLASVLLLEHRSLNLELREKHILKRDQFEALWKDMIDEGRRVGVFSDVDNSIAAKAVLGLMNWSITWFQEGGRYSTDELASQFADLFLSGLLSRNEVSSQ